jgi:hypothetical protein
MTLEHAQGHGLRTRAPHHQAYDRTNERLTLDERSSASGCDDNPF